MSTPEPVQTPTTDVAQGDKIEYNGTLGQKIAGVVHSVEDFFNESGGRVKQFIVRLEGIGKVLTSADTLTKVEAVAKDVEDVAEVASALVPHTEQAAATPQSITVPRSAYADTTVPPPSDPDDTEAAQQVADQTSNATPTASA